MLKCDMIQDCSAPISYIDNKGFIYCQEHGLARKIIHRIPCRKLKPAELKKLQSKTPIPWEKPHA